MAKKSPTGSLPPAVPLAITPTFRPWTHTSDDSYFYQLSLVVAPATESFSRVLFCILHCVVETCSSLAVYAATYVIYLFSVLVLSCAFHDFIRLVRIINFLSFWHYAFLPTIAFIASDR